VPSKISTSSKPRLADVERHLRAEHDGPIMLAQIGMMQAMLAFPMLSAQQARPVAAKSNKAAARQCRSTVRNKSR
jgi:hypothetical protein